MKNTDPKSTEIQFRCRAFTGEGVQLNKLSVSQDGSVRVWDKVSGYYTTCHSLTTRSINVARHLAGEKRDNQLVNCA